MSHVKELRVLQLTIILLFDKALKLSWLRGICNQTEGLASFSTTIRLIIKAIYMVVFTLKAIFMVVFTSASNKVAFGNFYPTNHTEKLSTPLRLSKEIYDIVDAKGHLLSMHE